MTQKTDQSLSPLTGALVFSQNGSGFLEGRKFYTAYNETPTNDWITMNIKKKFEETKEKIARHQTCVIAIGSMLVTAGVLGYLTGKELKESKSRECTVLDDILGSFADGEKHAAWLENETLYVQPEPLSAENL